MSGKQCKARKPEVFGKSKVTPTQIAFIVDRYLCDNNFSATSSTFRTEASSLIAHSPVHKVPKSLLTLGQMLDEYILLKEQKVMLDQEKVIVEHEKNRVQMLLQGMQNVMTAYNASGNLPPPAAKSAVAVIPQPAISVPTSIENRLNTPSLPPPDNSSVERLNISASVVNVTNKKRKDNAPVDAPSGAKNSRGRKVVIQGQNTTHQSDYDAYNSMVADPSAVRPSTENCITTVPHVQGSNVAKCIFNQSSQNVPSNSPVPKTPPRANSSHSDTNISPPETSSAATCNREATTTHCAVISTKRVMLSPTKQMAYIEMSHCISPVKTNSAKASKRDHVRSWLDFDSADVSGSSNNPLPVEVSKSESEKEIDMYDIDFSNFDASGVDFSEMLSELDCLPREGIDYTCLPASSPMDCTSGSPEECNDNHVTQEFNVSQVVCGQDMRVLGSDCLAETKSVRKSITVISPEKNQQQSLDQENCK